MAYCRWFRKELFNKKVIKNKKKELDLEKSLLEQEKEKNTAQVVVISKQLKKLMTMNSSTVVL